MAYSCLRCGRVMSDAEWNAISEGSCCSQCVVEISRENDAWMRGYQRRIYGPGSGEVIGRIIAVIIGLFVLLILAAQCAGNGSSGTPNPNPQFTTQDTLPPVQPLNPNPPALPPVQPLDPG